MSESEAGNEVMVKINDKAGQYMVKFGREPKYIILDSQSYLNLYAYFNREGLMSHPPGAIFTSICGLTPVVLPQNKRRIQVVGDDPMFTALNTAQSS